MCGGARVPLRGRLFHDYCGSARGNHEHAIFLAHDFVIDINSNNRIGTEIPSAFLEFVERNLARSLQLLLVSSGASSHQITNPGKHVLENVGAKDCFTGYDSAISGDALTFNTRCSGSCNYPVL